ncbi:hypothetical protein [Paraburkholderia lacunae]|nr:hypothetical protein [Paraburkholderia lacunae]
MSIEAKMWKQCPGVGHWKVPGLQRVEDRMRSEPSHRRPAAPEISGLPIELLKDHIMNKLTAIILASCATLASAGAFAADSASDDPAPKDAMTQEATATEHDAMSADSMAKDGMKEEAMDAMSHDSMAKEETKSDEVKQ